MKKKIIVASVFTVALIGGIIGIKSVSGGHHTSGAETKIVQKTTIQETTTAVQHETKAPVETKKKVDLIFPEKYKNVSAIKIERRKSSLKMIQMRWLKYTRRTMKSLKL